jgi:transposase-like protein
MDNRTCFCRNPRCRLYGRGTPLAQLKFCDWHFGAARFQCRACCQRVAARTGTAYTGVRTDLSTYRRGAVALAEGLSIRATGRLLGVDKDTVNHWLPMLGQHCQGVMNYFFRNLHLSECQLDELWTFIAKKQAHLTPLEQLQEVYGDAWVWIAFSPICKLVPAWVVGKRTLPHARRLVFQLKSATDGHIPFFTSDELPHYAHALLDVYGQWVQPPRQGTRGRLPKPRRTPPPDLCYAVVVKERENGRVVEVTTSNSHFDLLAGVRRESNFEAMEHKIEEVGPTGKTEIARERAEIIKEGLPADQRLSHQAIFGIQQV